MDFEHLNVIFWAIQDYRSGRSIKIGPAILKARAGQSIEKGTIKEGGNVRHNRTNYALHIA